MKSKTHNRIRFISSNSLRQILVSVFGMVIPFIVIHYSTKEIWGEFVSFLLYTLLVTQISNWGNKEYLLRKFSETPNKIKQDFSTVFVSRFPLIILFVIAGLFFFPIRFGFYIFLWILGRFLIHSFEALIIFDKKFKASVLIEIGSFLVFGLTFYTNKSVLDLKYLVILYSLYQLLKGVCYLILFKNYFTFKNIKITLNYFKVSFWFFILSVLGFLASKIDVYIMERFGNKIITSDYQIINSLLVFIMSITTFIYSPFTKNIYRNNVLVIEKTKKTISLLGLIIVPISLLMISYILRYFLNLDFSFWFYIIAFCYVFPSYLYGLEIVDLFKKHQEKTVVIYLLFGAVSNAFLSSLFLYLNYGIIGALLGSAMAQILVLLLFKFGKHVKQNHPLQSKKR